MFVKDGFSWRGAVRAAALVCCAKGEWRVPDRLSRLGRPAHLASSMRRAIPPPRIALMSARCNVIVGFEADAHPALVAGRAGDGGEIGDRQRRASRTSASAASSRSGSDAR